MSENTNFGFAKLVPGFDFLQNLAKGASQSMPNLSSWVAPTLSVEELDKRISELKAVHFWLDQNRNALSATIQALEVQKMTLATLQGMNFSMGELANALKLKPAPEAAPQTPAAVAAPAAAPKESTPGEKPAAKAKPKAKEGNGSAGAPVDPLQWWGALTNQFQEIAASAMKDVVQKAAADSAAANKAAGADKEPAKAAAKKAAAAPRKAAAKRAKAA